MALQSSRETRWLAETYTDNSTFGNVRDERAASENSDKASRKEGKGKLPVLVVCLICTGSIQHDDAQALRDGDQRRGEQPTQNAFPGLKYP
uniref:Uncharacterized protein n=1 Tax=Oryza rufipogon TaxID=4529 RepID=A0A0E0PFI4_ORYRU